MSAIRERALMVPCPKCRAGVGERCRKKYDYRKSVHRDRISASMEIAMPGAAALIKPKEQTFFETKAWRKVRYAALIRYGATCQCCGARPEKGKPLHVDHIKPRSRFPELELELDNLQVLCEDCNLGKGAWDETDWRAR